MADAETIAAMLDGELRASVLDGCSCGHADDLVALGLWKPEFDVPSEYYITTPLGLEVRRILSEQ